MKRYILLLMGVCCTIFAAAQTIVSYSVNPYDYQYDMTIYAVAKLDGTQLTSYTNYQVAAFVGDECRGVGSTLKAGSNTILYLRTYSNIAEGETVTFSLYDSAKSQELTASETLTFSNNATQGAPGTPFALTFTSSLLGDVDKSGDVTISDVVALISYLNDNIPATFDSSVADTNKDGSITAADIEALADIVLGK